MQDISMHILDIVENSIRAKATVIQIHIKEDREENLFSFTVTDNGKGMSPALLKEVKNPFTTSRTTRKVGLGIPMLNQTCQMCGGTLEIESKEQAGTRLTASMELNHIDRPPLGDISSTIYILIISNPWIDFHFTYQNKEIFVFDTIKIKEALDGVPITEPEISRWIKEALQEGIKSAA